MILIVGLGNPEKKYKKTRHNIGFMVLDKLEQMTQSSELRAQGFKLNKKFNALISKTKIEGKDVVLTKPQTYMNRSGESVRSLVSYSNIPLENVWIIFDDIDLDLGKIRVREDGSSGGHKGLESIIHFLGSEKFPRFRIGIKTNKSYVIPTEKFVLENFKEDELKIINQTIEKAIKEIEKALRKGIENVSIWTKNYKYQN